jgi:protein-tyrosine phosphatase
VSEFDILVVCIGNACRSPLAERLLRLRFDSLLGTARGAVRVSSAGVLAMAGGAMDARAAAELQRLGGDPSGFASTQLTSSMATAADLVLTATRDLRSRVLEDAPRTMRRTFTIREFAAITSSGVLDGRVDDAADLVGRAAAARTQVAQVGQDVPDPIGQSAAFHREVADILDGDCAAIARVLTGALLSGVSPL